jgi:hypothetical protein
MAYINVCKPIFIPKINLIRHCSFITIASNSYNIRAEKVITYSSLTIKIHKHFFRPL